jgi:hypothetical protein
MLYGSENEDHKALVDFQNQFCDKQKEIFEYRN